MSSHSTGSELRSESPRVVFTVAPPSVASWSPSDSSLDTADRSLPPVARSLLSSRHGWSVVRRREFAVIVRGCVVSHCRSLTQVVYATRPPVAPTQAGGQLGSPDYECAIPSTCRASDCNAPDTGCERSHVSRPSVTHQAPTADDGSNTPPSPDMWGISQERLSDVDLMVSGERFYLIFPNDNTRLSRSRVLSPTVSALQLQSCGGQ